MYNEVMDWDNAKLEASTLVENREHYQRRLGALASEIAEEFGLSKLDEFSDEIRNEFGLSVSSSTLRNYLWVYRKTKDLELPEDLSYRTLQYIVSSGEPARWAMRIKNEGLSSAEVYKMIMKERGQEKPVETVTCPACGHDFPKPK